MEKGNRFKERIDAIEAEYYKVLLHLSKLGAELQVVENQALRKTREYEHARRLYEDGWRLEDTDGGILLTKDGETRGVLDPSFLSEDRRPLRYFGS